MSSSFDFGPERLVELCRDEVQPLLESHALDRPRRRCELRLGSLVGDVLDDDRSLGEELPVVETQRGDVALGVDGEEALTSLERLLLQVDLLELERHTRFAERDVRRERAGAGCEIKFDRHECFLLVCSAATEKHVARASGRMIDISLL